MPSHSSPHAYVSIRSGGVRSFNVLSCCSPTQRGAKREFAAAAELTRALAS